MLNDFLIENNMLCLNTKFQKTKGQLWTHLSPNNLKSQIDNLMINKKWKLVQKLQSFGSEDYNRCYKTYFSANKKKIIANALQLDSIKTR